MLIVGPTDHGKSTLARLLTAYALRLDRTPIFVDLDVGQPMNSLPGTLTAYPLEKTCLNVEVRVSLPCGDDQNVILFLLFFLYP